MVFFGTPAFSVRCLDALVDAGLRPLLAVTRPDRPQGRGRKLLPSPVKERAAALDIPVSQPASIKTDEFLAEIRALAPDALAVVAYGRILPGALLGAARLGGVNVHPSLLPAYRGVAPIPRAILAGDAETGVTTILMNERIDAGGSLLVERLTIDPRDTTATLSARLAEVGGRLLVRSLRGLLEGALTPVAQDDSLATAAPKIEKAEGDLRWTDDAARIDRVVRAFQPWPGARARLRGKTVGVVEAAPAPEGESADGGAPGAVLLVEKDAIVVACGRNALRLLRLHPEGKAPMDARAFANGYRVAAGDRFEDGG